MAKAKKKTIVSYDALNRKLYKLTDGLLQEIDSKENPDYCVGFIPANHVKHLSIDVSESVSEVGEFIGNKVYEELNLDAERDYQIRYSLASLRSVDGMDFYNAIVVDTEILESTFKDILPKVKYVDYVDCEPLLYSTYYSNATFSGQGVDIFIYLHKQYATLTIYQDGEICSFRCINRISIDTLHAAYCHELAERIPEHVFIDELNQYGFDHIDDTKRVALNKVFAESSMLLINNISFTLRQLRMDGQGVNNVVVGTDIGLTNNFVQKIRAVFTHFKNSDVDTILEAMLENSSEATNNSLHVNSFTNIHKISYDLFKNLKSFANENEQCTVSPFVMMGFLRANEQIKENDETFNISTFLRPPPFFGRSSGRLIAAAVATFVLASIYPTINFINGYFAAEKTAKIMDSLPPIQSEHANIKAQIDSLNSQIDSINTQIASEKTRLDTRNALLSGLYDKKVNYLSKAQLIVDLTKELNRVNVYVNNISIKQDGINISLMGSSSAVTNLIRNLGASEKYIVDSKVVQIAHNGDDNYASELEIKVKQ